MTQRPGHLTTIVVEKETLRELKHMARKDETYNDLIKELMKLNLNQKTDKVNVDENVNENLGNGSGIATPVPNPKSSKG